MLTPREVVAEVIQYRRASAASTVNNSLHNHDKLCELLHGKLTDIGDCFAKYGQTSYVVQGPRDQGVDVLLKLSADDTPEKYVAFQIKSHREISDRKSDLSKLLKAAFHDARSHYGEHLVRYYIIFFGDPSNDKRISAITNEFTKDDRIRVIDSRYAKTLIDLDTITIAAIVDHFLRHEDFVLKKAKDEAKGLERNQLHALITSLSASYESSSTLVREDLLIEKYGLDKQTIDSLEGLSIEKSHTDGVVEIRQSDYPAIRALYYDIKVRYDYSAGAMSSHLTILLFDQFLKQNPYTQTD